MDWNEWRLTIGGQPFQVHGRDHVGGMGLADRGMGGVDGGRIRFFFRFINVAAIGEAIREEDYSDQYRDHFDIVISFSGSRHLWYPCRSCESALDAVAA